MAQSVKLADEIMTVICREAELQSRSVAGQITHWVRLGRAVETSGSFDHARLTAALEGRLDTVVELSPAEEAAWLDEFADMMAEPSEAERAFYGDRQTRGLGVGLDEVGRIVHARHASPT